MTGTLVAWVDGRLVPAGEAVVTVYDRGFRAGEGVFESFRAYGDHVFRLEAHLDRAVAGAATLRFDPGPREVLASAVRDTAHANLAALDGADSAVRLTVTAGPLDPDGPFPGVPLGHPTVVVTSHRLALDPAVAELGVSAVTVPWARELPQVKAVSYVAASLARAEARRRGATEALLTDAGGDILEGSASNVFVVRDDAVATPPLDAGLLAGVTRSVVLEVAAAAGIEVRERPVGRRDLLTAQEALLTSTTREVIPLVTVDGARIGSGRPGPITARIAAAYRDEVTRERAARST